MEYNTLQESGILSALKSKLSNLEIGFQGKLETIIWDALENEIEELPEYIQQDIQDDIYDLSCDLESHVERIICDL